MLLAQRIKRANDQKSVNTFPSGTAVRWSGSLLFIAILLKINTAAPSLLFPPFDHKMFFASSGKKIEFPCTLSLPCKCSATPYLIKQRHRAPDYEPLLDSSCVVFNSLCLSGKRLYKEKCCYVPTRCSEMPQQVWGTQQKSGMYHCLSSVISKSSWLMASACISWNDMDMKVHYMHEPHWKLQQISGSAVVISRGLTLVSLVVCIADKYPNEFFHTLLTVIAHVLPPAVARSRLSAQEWL